MELDLDAMETCCKFLFVGGGANIYNKHQYVLKHLKKRRFLYQAFSVFLPRQKIISLYFRKKTYLLPSLCFTSTLQLFPCINL